MDLAMRKVDRSLLVLSLVASGMMLLACIFEWDIVEALTVFVAPFVLLGVRAAFLLGMLGTLVYCGVNLVRRRRPSLVAPAIYLFTFAIILWFPFTALMLKLDFRMKFVRRMEVVSMVERGVLAASASEQGTVAALPFMYRDLSRSGEILVERKNRSVSVFFFTFRGVLDNFSGFVYRSSGDPPTDEDFYGDYKEIIKLRDRWYWAASY